MSCAVPACNHSWGSASPDRWLAAVSNDVLRHLQLPVHVLLHHVATGSRGGAQTTTSSPRDLHQHGDASDPRSANGRAMRLLVQQGAAVVAADDRVQRSRGHAQLAGKLAMDFGWIDDFIASL